MNLQRLVCACGWRGAWTKDGGVAQGGRGRSGSRLRRAQALLVAPGSRERAGAAPRSPLAHTKPRRGENGGRGRSSGRGGGDGAQNGGRERHARRAERQRGSGPEGVSMPRFLLPGWGFSRRPAAAPLGLLAATPLARPRLAFPARVEGG
jgi:hypothetical protein